MWLTASSLGKPAIDLNSDTEYYRASRVLAVLVNLRPLICKKGCPNIAMTHFTPVSAVAGGVLIGLASALLLLSEGRIAGISGITAGLVRGSESVWRWLFVLGLVLGAVIYGAVGGDLSAIQIHASWPLLVAGGLLVGFGTRLGSGCTSGHGVCGISRFSVRSIVATLVFMVTAGIVVFVTHHLLGGY